MDDTIRCGSMRHRDLGPCPVCDSAGRATDRDPSDDDPAVPTAGPSHVDHWHDLNKLVDIDDPTDLEDWPIVRGHYEHAWDHVLGNDVGSDHVWLHSDTGVRGRLHDTTAVPFDNGWHHHHHGDYDLDGRLVSDHDPVTVCDLDDCSPLDICTDPSCEWRYLGPQGQYPGGRDVGAAT